METVELAAAFQEGLLWSLTVSRLTSETLNEDIETDFLYP
jgi:hypothetical protein